MVLTLGLNLFVVSLLAILFLFICVVLILTVLIQRPQGGGLSGAFGSGAGSGQTAFGAKTGDALTWFTVIMFGVWLAGAVGLNYAVRPPEALLPTGAELVAPLGEGDPAEETGAAPEGEGAPPTPAEGQPVADGPAAPSPAGDQPEAPPGSPGPQPVPPSEPAPAEPIPSAPPTTPPSEPEPS